MTEQQQIELFEKQKWYDKWKDNCLKDDNEPEQIIKTYWPEGWIKFAFPWKYSNEGKDFWEEKDDEWCDLLRKKR